MTQRKVTSRLKLFLSVDMVGSTALKQRAFSQKESSVAHRRRWVNTIKGLYTRMQTLFASSWNRERTNTAQKSTIEMGEPPRLWKTAGDEVLFTKKLTHHLQALVCLKSFIEAVREYRTELQGESADLDLKIAAWLAGFPVINAEIAFDEQSQEAEEVYSDSEPARHGIRDYIGPYIDIGFRLASLADARKAIVSVDLLHMLLNTSHIELQDAFFETYRLFYDGRKPLKGVLGGEPYPVFSLDTNSTDDLTKLENALRVLNKDDTRKFVRSFIDYNDTIVFPYITSDLETHDEFCHPPKEHGKYLDQLEGNVLKEDKKTAPAAEGPKGDRDVPESVKKLGLKQVSSTKRKKRAKRRPASDKGK